MSDERKYLRTSVKIAPDACICNECELIGEISIGSKTIIHPRASIIAEAGPIHIGDNNLIEEQARIHNKPSNLEQGTTPVLIIGSGNVFEVNSHSESRKIGDNNTLEPKSFIGREVQLTNGIVIGAGCRITCPEVIPENTVIFGKQCHRRIQGDKPPPHTLQQDFLMRVLPNYHHLKKSSKK